ATGATRRRGDHDGSKAPVEETKTYAVVGEGRNRGGGRRLADPSTALYGGATPSRDSTVATASTPPSLVQTADDGGVGHNSLLLTKFGASGTFFVDVGSIGTAPEGAPGKVQDIGQGTSPES